MVVKVAEQSGWRIAKNGDKAEGNRNTGHSF
ncbi:Uncharacterised protein [Klebsiella pneumoniae]|nr:Uncharacterised protein [Klebsiella pneumoniae]STV19206.1 Uncharacterised protein [Klebsiella pneumoniae]SWP54318.1 Uncharacterised protein [Klebsiella pneumoniae]SYU97684.1 Uncharacterised protein [Klebsiella pneumoniae]VAT65196.1 Uncharacterised protein [Klebsiella pneumoniae]